MIFKTKQLRAYRDYLRGIRSNRPEVNDAEEELVGDIQAVEASALPVDEEDASYLGEELAHIAALGQLPPPLPDTPHDTTRAAEHEFAKPEFAITCSLASKLVGRPQEGGKLLRFTFDAGCVIAIVENHAVANVDVLFHDAGETCESHHEHKVGIDGDAASQKLAASLAEM